VEHQNTLKPWLHATRLITILDDANHWMQTWFYVERDTVDENQGFNDFSWTKETDDEVRINAAGLGLLRQFENLQSYCEQGVREIERAVLRQVKVPLTSNQFSALVSLTYDLGEASLKRSLLLQYLNAGCYQEAANEFDRWIYIGSRSSSSLRARRRAEKRLFLKAERQPVLSRY
jgi:hypothetical protein